MEKNEIGEILDNIKFIKKFFKWKKIYWLQDLHTALDLKLLKNLNNPNNNLIITSRNKKKLINSKKLIQKIVLHKLVILKK